MLRRAVLALLLVATSTAVAAPRRGPRVDNMPHGFAWPPSAIMTAAAAACEAQLDAAGVTRAAAKPEGHMVDPVTPTATTDAHRFALGGVTYVGVFGAGPYVMDCQLASALTTLGETLREQGVTEVHFGSIYRWTKVRVGGMTKNMLSRHALGLAMDVVSVVDADGAEHVVAHDYLREPGATGRLHAIEAAVNHSGHFRLVLTPTNDPVSHHDHFHLEADVDYTRSRTSS